jgi:ribosomal protein S8
VVFVLLHIGDDVVIPKKNIIAILEMDTKASQVNKEFLEIAGDEGFIEKISDGKESSFVVTTEKIYYSPISCTTLKKRAESVIGR